MKISKLGKLMIIPILREMDREIIKKVSRNKWEAVIRCKSGAVKFITEKIK